jgi:hypothetical protein
VDHGDGSSGFFPLRRCEGHCQSDADCARDMLCFQRDGVTGVPGCLGPGVVGHNYCIGPFATLFVGDGAAMTGELLGSDTGSQMFL